MAILNVSLSEFLGATSFSGVSDIDTPSPASQEWASQMARYSLAQTYFSGDIFNKRSDERDPNSSLLYPLKINLVRMMCLTQAANLWGQWEDKLLDLSVKPLKENKAAIERADRALAVVQETWDACRVETKLYEGGLSQQVYGGVFLRNAIDMGMPHGVRIDKLMPYNVFPRWHPIHVDRILEAYIVIPIDRREAELAYGISAPKMPDETVYIEHWTESAYETLVGDVRLESFSGINPWGFVPVEYIPVKRLEGFYGLPLTEDLMGLQDELNARLADVGDDISNAAHPIRWVRNYRGDPHKDFEMGSDALWDMGQGMPGQDPPEVGVIKGQPIPASSFNFINFVLDMTRYSSFTSPVAFGEDQGSQRSGRTLELRLWPMMQQAKGTRIYYRAGLLSLHRKLLKMVEYRDTAGKYTPGMAEHAIMPNFASLVPSDRDSLVDEVTRRAEQDLISPEESLARFGVQLGTEVQELERIKQWMEYKKSQKPESFGQPPGEPSDQPADNQLEPTDEAEPNVG